VAEIIRSKEALSYDERYRLRVANKQKAYKDLFGVQPNEEPGFFLPLSFYDREQGDSRVEFLHLNNDPAQYVDGFEIKVDDRRFIIMRDSFFEDDETGMRLVHAESIVLSLLDESAWPDWLKPDRRNNHNQKVSGFNELLRQLTDVGDIDNMTALALGLGLGEKPKEFLGGPVYKDGHNAYWNLVVNRAVEDCGFQSEGDLRVTLSTIGLTTIDTLPRITEEDNPIVNVRTEMNSLKEAVDKYQGVKVKQAV